MYNLSYFRKVILVPISFTDLLFNKMAIMKLVCYLLVEISKTGQLKGDKCITGSYLSAVSRAN